MLSAMRRAIACAALLTGCGDNGSVPDAPVAVIADAAPDAAVMPCTAGIELVGQFTATNAGSPPEVPVTMPTVGHPDGFDLRVASWHVNHDDEGDTILIADSAVKLAFTGYDAAVLNTDLAPVLTLPDLGGALFQLLPHSVLPVTLQIATLDRTAIMTADCGGLLGLDNTGVPTIAPLNLSCSVTFSQDAPDGTLIKLANGNDGAIQLVCD